MFKQHFDAEVATEFPAKRNAVSSAKPGPDPVAINYRKTSRTPARLFVKRMLYHTPVKRNASQLSKLKAEGEARIARRMHPVNETVRPRPRLKENAEAEDVVSGNSSKRQPRKSRAYTAPAPRKELESESATPENSSEEFEDLTRSEDSGENISRSDDEVSGSDENIKGSGDINEESGESIDDLSS